MKIKKVMAGMLAMVTVMGSLMSPLSAKADQIDAPYLALGADLNETEKSTVLSLLEINEADLSSYQVITVTNADEHKYLDSYLDSSVIGTRALSSVLIEKKDKGNGIKVTTSNITYCTTGMYQNALATAGVTDADVRVGLDQHFASVFMTMCVSALALTSLDAVICAEIEAEISELDDDEKKMFLEDLGLEKSGLDKLISASYSLLGLISYLTSGADETRAWTITKGTKAPQAAGKIHSDFERGFIRAEVVSYQDLMDCQSYVTAREKGLVRLEGKDYVVQDGDVILFRFNV